MLERRIYVDLDDVLCETAQMAMEIARRLFARETLFEQIRSFDLGVSFDLSAGETRRLMDELNDPATLVALPARIEGIRCLHQWADMGCEFFVVTGRPPATRKATEQWLADNDIPCCEVLFVDKYGRYSSDDLGSGPAAVKLNELERFEFSLAIEDSAEMAHFLSEQLKIPVILLDRPWNSDHQFLPEMVHRCHTWEEATMAARTFPQ